MLQNTHIWAFGIEVWKTKVSRTLQISPILKFWVVCNYFWVVSAGVGSFWLVPDFRKYAKLAYIQDIVPKIALSIVLENAHIQYNMWVKYTIIVCN